MELTDPTRPSSATAGALAQRAPQLAVSRYVQTCGKDAFVGGWGD